MGYKALITLDLPSASDKQRELFYESLSKNHWYKIQSLTTAWLAGFQDSITRESALSALESDLLNAKNYSEVYRVEYAIQLALIDIVIKTI